MSQTRTDDALLGGRVRLLQPTVGFRAAIDPVLLAAAVPARSGERVLEAGCGSGAAFLCLAARVPGLHVRAVERDPALAALAAENAARNGCAAEILAGPVEAGLPGGLAHAFANPPWWSDGTESPQAARRAATHGDATLLNAWAAALAGSVVRGGTVTLVLPAARFAAAIAALLAAGCGGVRLLPIRPRAGAAASRVLVQARRDSRAPAAIAPALVLHGPGNGYTDAAEAILRGGGALAL